MWAIYAYMAIVASAQTTSLAGSTSTAPTPTQAQVQTATLTQTSLRGSTTALTVAQVGNAEPNECEPSLLLLAPGLADEFYNCSKVLADGIILHWYVGNNSRADLALEKQDIGGFLALGFIEQPGLMVPADALVAPGDGSVRWDRLEGYFEASITPRDARFGDASASVENGRTVLRVANVEVANLQKVDLMFAHHPSCTWPCSHGFSSNDFGDFTVNLLQGQVVGNRNQNQVVDEAIFIFMACGGLFALLVIGAMVVCCFRGDRGIHRPIGPMKLSCANLFAVILALGVLIVLCMALGTLRSTQKAVTALGLAAGVSAALPIFWAFMKAGVHNAVGMSREAAWRIHIAFGILTLVFGLAHGASAYLEYGFGILEQKTLGFAGLVLMVLGVLPAVVYGICPCCITYDSWKRLHFASLLGYTLVLVHIVESAKKGIAIDDILVTRDFVDLVTPAATVAIINVVALMTYILQKISVRCCRYQRVSVADVTVISEENTEYTMLRLHTPGFKYSPGQWCLLRVPKLSGVAHPFTIVPDNEEDHIQLCVKTSGRFTSRLANSCREGAKSAPAMRLEGPFGIPPLRSESFDAAVFVLGGIGVTPALSLVAEASRTCGDLIRVFWSAQSAELLTWCAPMIESHLPPWGNQCIRLSHTGVPGNTKTLPCGAKHGRDDVTEYLATVTTDLATQGAKSALVYICGPVELARATRRAVASEKAKGITWHVHEAQFNFLPQCHHVQHKVQKSKASMQDTEKFQSTLHAVDPEFIRSVVEEAKAKNQSK